MKSKKTIILIWCLLALLSIANSFIFPMALFAKIVSWAFGFFNILAMIGFGIIMKEEKRMNYEKNNM